MRKELDELLCSKYPEIFKERHGDPRNTAMVWGFSCGDGWFSLIDQLCLTLSSEAIRLRDDIKHMEDVLAEQDKSKWQQWQHTAYNEEKLAEKRNLLVEATKKIPVALQVKEKFGGLRFYVHGGTEEQQNYVRFAEGLSYRICEECGAMDGTKLYTMGWHRVLCPKHAIAEYGEDLNEADDE